MWRSCRNDIDVILTPSTARHHQNAKIAFSGFLMTSSLLKVSITQMDINFCILF